MIPPWLTANCPRPSPAHEQHARDRQSTLTKPAGSLGQLEALAITLAALQSRDKPQAHQAPIIIFAADHGVTAQGISAFPADVTVQMLANFASGGAAISVLARELGVPLTVVDCGTLAPAPLPGVVTDKPRCGTRDFSQQAALTEAELSHAFACGQRAIIAAMKDGADLFILGEMGIGNTTAASAIACALTGLKPDALVGAGTGIDATGRARKVQVVSDALILHGLGSATLTARVLACVGGLEIAAMSGAIIAAAQARIPVLVDGFIVTVAALAAVRMNPSCRPWLIFSHTSAERGHQLVLQHLDARPLLDLQLRLGEASGAAIALPLLRLSCALHNGMATFAEAAVSGREAT
jgi:nicotinate-nucleotide--dimethylbenzimidazole phosphoribosyltransferase